MRSTRLLTVAVLAVVLALSSTQNAFASTEIFYDAGPPPFGYGSMGTGDAVAVRFSLLSGCFSVSGARIYAVGSGFVKLHVESSPGVDLITPITESVSAGWNSYTLATGGISGDFYIAAEVASGSFGVGRTEPGHGRSYFVPTGGSWALSTDYDEMIRAEVDPSTGCTVGPVGASVGGFMEPVNKLAIVAPWLAVIAASAP